LCNKAELVDGKIYVLGGGWSWLPARQFPETFVFTVVAILSVPWHRREAVIPVALEIGDADGAILFGGPAVGFPASMATASEEGADLRLHCLFYIQAVFPAPGAYTVRLDVDGRERASTKLYVRSTA
jgi:hypothetical protein